MSMVENCNNPALVSKEDWSLSYVDSEEINYPGYATMTFDDDPSTIWHTQWSTGDIPYPHEMQIDLNNEYKIFEFTYKQGKMDRMDELKIWVYFSNDSNDFGTADTVIQFENTSAPQTIIFQNPKIGSHMKIIVSEVNGGPWSSATEFDLKACYKTLRVETKDFEFLNAYPIPTSGPLKVSLPSIGIITIYTIDGKYLE